MSLEGKQIDRYLILRLLGSGGMGDVYLAEDPRIGQQVAIKVIRTEQSPYPDEHVAQNAARLFQREAKAIVRLDHPHILPLYDYGEEHIANMPVIYLVMPYRSEGSLTDWLRRRESKELLSPQDIAHLVSQAADALQHAHDHYVIHQDVKPSNFLVRSRKETPAHPDLLLSDFGIAKFATATSSVSQSIRGTPSYMAPEQWEGEPVSATDQYALAVMIYELLTGKLPFKGGPSKMMYQHINIQPQPPSSINLHLSNDIDIVLMHALAKQPDKRFASITAFANAFQQAANIFDEKIFANDEVIEPDDLSTLQSAATPQNLDFPPTLNVQPETFTPPVPDNHPGQNIPVPPLPHMPSQPDEKARSNRLIPRRKYLVGLVGLVVAGTGLSWLIVTQGNRSQKIITRKPQPTSTPEKPSVTPTIGKPRPTATSGKLQPTPDKPQPTATPGKPQPTVTPQTPPGTTIEIIRHTGTVTSVAWSPDGKLIASGSLDGYVYFNKPMGGVGFSHGFGYGISSVAWSSDSKYTAVGLENTTGSVFVQDFSGARNFEFLGNGGSANTVAWSPDGRYVVSGDAVGKAHVFDAASGQGVFDLQIQGNVGGITIVAWSPNGRSIAVGFPGSPAVQMFDAASGYFTFDLQGTVEYVNSIAWSPDGKHVAIGSEDSNGTVQVFDATSGQRIIGYKGNANGVYSVDWSPDGRYIVSGGSDNIARVCEAGTGNQVIDYAGHTGAVTSVDWSPDGRYIVSGGTDKTARVWIA